MERDNIRQRFASDVSARVVAIGRFVDHGPV